MFQSNVFIVWCRKTLGKSKKKRKKVHFKHCHVCVQVLSGVLVCCTCQGFSLFPQTLIIHDMKRLRLKTGICVLSTRQRGNSFWAAIPRQTRVGVSFYRTVKSVKNGLRKKKKQQKTIWEQRELFFSDLQHSDTTNHNKHHAATVLYINNRDGNWELETLGIGMKLSDA